MYCSTKSESGDHTPGGTYPRNLEALLVANKVDLVITGHEHLYERMNAIINGTVVTAATGVNNTYVSPGAPVYVVAGASGAFQSGDWITPVPAWSANRQANVYGYGKMRVTGASKLQYDFVDFEGKVHDSWAITK